MTVDDRITLPWMRSPVHGGGSGNDGLPGGGDCDGNRSRR